MLADKTHWSATEIYALRLPRLWSLLEGFRKLADMRSGTGTEERITDPAQAAAALSSLGSAGRERSFDCLPLKIQEWSRRCREVNKHGK